MPFQIARALPTDLTLYEGEGSLNSCYYMGTRTGVANF